MDDLALFKLLGWLSEERDKAAVGRLQVVPVLLDGVGEATGLLDAFARHNGGVMLDLTGPDFDGAMPSRADDPELRAHLEAKLQVLRAGALHHVRITVSGGAVDAEYLVDGDPQVATGGWRVALAMCRALFSTSIENSEIAVIAYSEAELDVRLRSRILLAFTEMVPVNLRLGTMRTLIVIAETPWISVGAHCIPGRGIRYALLSDGLQRRRPLSQLNASTQVFAQPRDKPIVLFLGAGFSASSHLPMGNQLRNETIGRICDIDPTDLSDTDLAEAFWDFAQTHNLLLPTERDAGRDAWTSRLTLEHVVRIESEHYVQAIPQTIADFAALHDRVLASSIGECVLALRRLVARRARLILVTVNFDELLEQPSDDLDIAVTEDEFRAITPKLRALVTGGMPPDDRIPYLKLHGTISRPETCIASDRQTLTGLPTWKREAISALVTDLVGDPLFWVYVGASMRDMDLRPVFEMREFHTKVEEYWAVPYLEPSVRRFAELRHHSWPASRSIQERLITEVSDAFIPALEDLWPT